MNDIRDTVVQEEEDTILGAMYISDCGNDEEISEIMGNMHNFADKNNITIVEKYIDKENDGKGLDRLLKEVQDQTLKLDVLLVTNINILISGTTNVDIYAQLGELGIEVINTL